MPEYARRLVNVNAQQTTVTVGREVILDLKRLQLAIEETEGRKPTMSEIIRRALDAMASLTAPAGRTS